MPAKRVYLDTSSIVKRYVHEEGSEVIDGIYESAEVGRLQVFFSVWNVGEVLGAFDTYMSRKIVTRKEFRSALANFVAESIKLGRLGSLTMTPLSAKTLVESWALVLDRHIYEADALQIAAAKDNRCDLLLTADKKLVQASGEAGMYALNPESDGKEIQRLALS